jgi:hypothetical protein
LVTRDRVFQHGITQILCDRVDCVAPDGSTPFRCELRCGWGALALRFFGHRLCDWVAQPVVDTTTTTTTTALAHAANRTGINSRAVPAH